MDITSVFELGKAAIERIWPDPIKRAVEMRKLEELKQKGELAALDAEVKLLLKQAEINLADAKSGNIFQAGWRPAIGWTCVAVMAFNYIGVFILEYIAAFVESSPPVPERMNMTELWPLMLGMLGVGGMRSFDKTKGTNSDKS